MRNLLILVLGVFILAGCQRTTEPEGDLQVDDQLTDQAAVGFEINELAASVEEIESLTNGTTAMQTGTSIPLQSTAGMKEQISRMGSNASDAARNISVIEGIARVAADSLLWSGEQQFPKYTKRWAIYYDPVTGIARYYEVKDGSMMFHLIYDSTEVKVDLNKTLDNDSDDKVKSLYHQQIFDEAFFVNKIQKEIEVTDYDGNDASGFIASEDSWYSGLGKLSHKSASIEINPDGSGTLQETLEFSDGSSTSATVTFKSDHSGTFVRKLRNGVNISGSFNRVEDDLHGFYDETIDFPSGHYLDKIRKYAEVTITLPDSILDGLFRHIIHFSSGDIDSAKVKLQISWNDGVKKTEMEITKHNGAHGALTVEENELGKTMEGKWTTWDGHFIMINGEYMFDGSGSLHYEIYTSESAYESGDDPILTADYNFYPDKTGDGLISYNGETYDVEFDENGDGFLKQQGKQIKFHLFHHTGK